MKRKAIEKASVAVLICLLFAMIPGTAFSWNQATHAYIADRVGARVGHDDLNEMWGSTAPDMFNFVFDPTLCPGWIADQTQGTYSDTFLKVWNAADTHDEEAMAYGFVSHNEQWGADHIAHESSFTFGQDEGYIIAKLRILLDTPYPDDPQKTFDEIFADLGMSPYEGEMIAHLITEYAIDIMLGHEVDPLLGRKLATAAHARSKEFPSLLIKAFGKDYADYCFDGDTATAAYALIAVEEEHRKEMIFLGRAISQPEPVAVQLLSERVVSILPEFMGSPLPVSDAEAVEIVRSAINNAMGICDDYMAEIDATIEYVDKNLKDHGITYSIRGNPKGTPRSKGDK